MNRRTLAAMAGAQVTVAFGLFTNPLLPAWLDFFLGALFLGMAVTFALWSVQPADDMW
jgi:hypothetical protein